MTAGTLDALAREAIDGDRESLDRLVVQLQGHVFGLAVRMLWNREDAEDATQEILVRVVTRLAQFDFRSQLHTWVYRIAVNYILDTKKSPVERMRLAFDTFAEDLADGLSDDGPHEGERSVLVEEVRVGCTLAMLQCLDRPHRFAYVLGEIFELTGPEAADALEITPVLFRKRLQEAREAVVAFTSAHCGLVSANAKCACHRRVPAAVQTGRVEPERLHFATTPSSFLEARSVISRVEETRRALALQQTSTPRQPPSIIARRIVESFDRSPSQ